MTLDSSAHKPMSKSFIALLLLLWARYPLWEYIGGAFSYVPGFNSLSEYSIAIITGVLAIVSLKEIAKRISISDILFFVVVVAVYFISYSLHPENQSVLDERYTQKFLLTVLPYYFVGILINMDKCEKGFLYTSYFSILCQFIYVFVLNKGGIIGNEADDMIGHAYYLLSHVTYIAYWLIEKKSLSSGLFFAIGFLLMISMANRGSIVCLLSFMFLYYVITRVYKQKFSTKLTVIIGGSLLIVFFNPLTTALLNFMSGLNLNTRVVDKALTSSFMESEGRSDITDAIFKSFGENVFEMHGIGGENQLGIIYAHNLLIEWWYSFGIIIGSILMISLLYLIIKAFLESSGVSKFFLLLLITSGFECLFLSGTYLSNQLFFMLIGFSVNCIRRSKVIV